MIIMNIIAWIVLTIVGLNVIAFGLMWWVFIWEERGRKRGEREGDQHRGAD